MTQKLLVYIGGSGHSGSTLLDMLLGGHPSISALGEIHRIYMSANNDSAVHLCTCGQHVMQCPMWRAVASELGEILDCRDPEILKQHQTTRQSNLNLADNGQYIEHEPPAPYRFENLLLVLGSRLAWRTASSILPSVKESSKILTNSLTLFEAVRLAQKTPVIVDSTKNPARMKGLYLESPASFRLLTLVRDGRAVCLSRMKRENLSMEASAKIWVSEQLKQRVTRATIPSSQKIRCKYEAVCSDPEKELTRICERLGLEFHPSMLDFRGERHNIGGNPMRYRENDTTIRLDDKWRCELTTSDLSTFERIAGSTNRRLGYTE